ncbi:hypothetical protein [Microbacterium sp. SLBN-146]|uniref:hypothetical protein n=1 Tax=Microbacterium sp. SLBN-146 TaxID=2768457 RepID=UPI00114D7695|nr:hypothetical protein [Microbacterium sp. SLBN-146]TQJ31536.1 hypothetical protein FBY39_2013 [Microbacterium sp. SLBN-146]
MTNDKQEVARRLDTVVAETDGVVELYAARPMVAHLLRQALDANAPRIAVDGFGDAASVAVSIGVVGEAPALETARRVADEVRRELGEPDVRLTVRVSRIVATRPDEAEGA